ncbi:MAG: methyltransferase domain-containing protein [Rhodospirillaceae bacterium]|jgi:arsenite methyltransferase|nr:methyltransferase domain-containing protein [Rhodospirillaceae bacterium]
MPIEFDEKAARSLERSYQTPEIATTRRATLDALGLCTGEHAADMGCGPGFLVAEMAGMVGPEGRAVGIDTSPDMLALATNRTDNLPQVEVVDADLLHLPFEDGAFDALACTQLLLFIKDIQRALAEMRRVLKPGGRIAIIETDWRGVVLNAEDDSLTRRMFAAWDAAAISPNLPTRLKPALLAAGFTGVGVEGVPIINTDFGRDGFSNGMLRGVAKKAQKDGAISDDEATAWIDDLNTKDAEGAYFFCVNRFLFRAEKP